MNELGSRQPKLAFVFCGQGGEWWRMGRQLLREEPVFRRSIDECDEALRPWIDWSLHDELLRGERNSRISEIDVAVPAMFAIQVALTSLWKSWGIAPDAVVGHSTGEVAAAHAAGALSLEDAAGVSRHMGHVLKRVGGQGGMAVVELSPDEARHVIAPVADLLSVGGSNSPRATVLSGDLAALDDVLETLEQEGVFSRMLRVDFAPHSPQMDPLRKELVELIGELAPRAADMELFSSVTGGPLPGEAFDARYWGRNLREPFVFADTVARMAQSDYTCYVEIGPHPILRGAIGDVQVEVGKALVTLPSLTRGKDDREVMLGSLGALYEHGFSPARELYRHSGHLVSLPTEPRRGERSRPAGAAAGSLGRLIGQLLHAQAEDRVDLMAEHLRATIARVLGCRADELDIGSPLNTIGFDSILAAEVRNQINFELGVRVPMLALLRGTTRELAARLIHSLDPTSGRESAGAAIGERAGMGGYQ